MKAVRRTAFSSCCAPALCHRAVIHGGLCKCPRKCLNIPTLLLCRESQDRPTGEGAFTSRVVCYWPWCICSLWSPVGTTQPSSGYRSSSLGCEFHLPPSPISTLEHRGSWSKPQRVATPIPTKFDDWTEVRAQLVILVFSKNVCQSLLG